MGVSLMNGDGVNAPALTTRQLTVMIAYACSSSSASSVLLHEMLRKPSFQHNYFISAIIDRRLSKRCGGLIGLFRDCRLVSSFDVMFDVPDNAGAK